MIPVNVNSFLYLWEQSNLSWDVLVFECLGCMDATRAREDWTTPQPICLFYVYDVRIQIYTRDAAFILFIIVITIP